MHSRSRQFAWVFHPASRERRGKQGKRCGGYGGHTLREPGNKEPSMLKFLGGTVGIIFIIGLIVVIGLFQLLF
jgi:hypothetical protein